MLKLINPFDQSLVAEVPTDDAHAVEVKLAAACGAFAQWKRAPLDERARQVRRGLENLRAESEQLARDITLQMGKPIAEARREVTTMFARAEASLATAASALAPDVVPAADGFHLRIEHCPLGVVLNIAAWNYPLLIPINVIVPALLAGNVVLLKHSARTALTGQAFASAFGQLEPQGLLASVILSHDETARLIADPRVAHVAFTGSVEGGRAVYRQAAQRFIDAGLELGGKDPAYVAADADLAHAAENIVDGACYNAGQSCCSIERVYVHRSRYDEFLARAKAVMERYRLGNPLDETTTIGPLASRAALDFLEQQVADTTRRGGKVLLGGKRTPDTAGNFFPPTLLAGVPNGADVMQEESFGPLCPVLAVADDHEALARMNETHYGLTAAVWTRDCDRAEWFAREIDAGTIFQNRCDYLDPQLPWTGVRDSGKGSTLSRYGFHHLTRRKSLHFRLET